MKKLLNVSALCALSIMLVSCATVSGGNKKSAIAQVVNKDMDQIYNNNAPRYFNIRNGDSMKAIFTRMGNLNGNIYVLSDSGFTSLIDVDGIKAQQDLLPFFEANGYELKMEPLSDTNYVKVTTKKLKGSIEKKLLEIPVSLSGNMRSSDVVDMVAQAAGIKVEFRDKSASDMLSIGRYFNYTGDGAGALKYISEISGLSLDYKTDGVILSYFDTATMSIDIFTRDRSMMSSIANKPDLTSSNQSADSTNASTAMKDLKIAYTTELVKELRGGIESSLSKNGSYSFLPTTGQVVVHDQVNNIRSVQKIVSDFNAKFKDTISGKLTFYKVTANKSNKTGLDLKALVGNHFNFSASGMVNTAFSSVGATAGNFAVGVTSGNDNGLFQFLQTVGSTEIVNSIDFETQSNSVKTIKIANNYGYISSVTSNIASGSTGATTSGAITPSSVPDGTFISLIGKNIGNGAIALDLYTTANSLSKFNTANAFGTTVQTPDTAEQSVDGYHQVRTGVPYILLSYKYNETKHDQNGLPVGIDFLNKIGSNVDENKDVFIVIALEAFIK